VVGQQNADIADILQLRDVSVTTIFVFQSVLNFDNTAFLFPNSKVFRILRKSVQTSSICRRLQTNTSVSGHFDARIPLEALLCRLPKSFVFNS